MDRPNLYRPVGREVRLTSDIYRSAEAVTVWLGETSIPVYRPNDLWLVDLVVTVLRDPYFV
jgi:hypothetical protein